MIKKTVYEFGPDDVDNALRIYFEGRSNEKRLIPVVGQDPIFGVVCADKVIEDACKAAVERQIQVKPGSVWKFSLERDSDGRVSVSVSLI